MKPFPHEKKERVGKTRSFPFYPMFSAFGYHTFAQPRPTAPSPVWRQMLRGRETEGAPCTLEGRLDLVVPSVAYGTVTAGVAGVNRHSHPGKAGGQIVAEGRDHGFLGVEHSPNLSIGVQLTPWIWRTGLIWRMVAMAAPAAVTRPLFRRYSKVLTAT